MMDDWYSQAMFDALFPDAEITVKTVGGFTVTTIVSPGVPIGNWPSRDPSKVPSPPTTPEPPAPRRITFVSGMRLKAFRRINSITVET